MASGERSLAFCHDSHWTIQVASTGNIINILDPEEYILSWWPPTTSNGVTRDNIHISCFFLHFNKNCQQCFSNVQSYPKFCNQFPSFWNPRIADINQRNVCQIELSTRSILPLVKLLRFYSRHPSSTMQTNFSPELKENVAFFSVKSWFWENPPPCTMVHARILSTYRRSIKEGLWKNHPPRYQPPFWFTKLISILVIQLWYPYCCNEHGQDIVPNVVQWIFQTWQLARDQFVWIVITASL